MALEFTETAPGVHTATLSDPKTGQGRNIAIIESCDAWQLFIDGELAARDLPSFNAAVQQGKQAVGKKSGRLMGTTSLVMLGSVAGALVIGSTILAAPFWTAPAEGNATPAGLSEFRAAIKRVEVPAIVRTALTGKTNPPSVVSTKAAPASAPTERAGPRQKIASESANAQPTPLAETVAPPAAIENVRAAKVFHPSEMSPYEAVKPEVRLFSSENPVLAEPATAARKQAKAETKAAPIPSVKLAAFNKTPATTAVKPREPFQAPSKDVVVSAALTEKNVPIEREAEVTTSEPLEKVSALEAPPLPEAAPHYTRPIIRPITVSVKPAASAAQPKRYFRSRPNRAKTIKRSRPVKPTASTSRRRAIAKSRLERARQSRQRKVRTANNHRRQRSRRMVCFANVCRWQ